jgi:hypothetical protein
MVQAAVSTAESDCRAGTPGSSGNILLFPSVGPRGKDSDSLEFLINLPNFLPNSIYIYIYIYIYRLYGLVFRAPGYKPRDLGFDSQRYQIF